ncbi:MAG: hypothetical protein ACE5F2_02815, partial [Candidatus Paceibacteria bacterium]
IEKLCNYIYTEYTHQDDDTFIFVVVSAKLCEVRTERANQKFLFNFAKKYGGRKYGKSKVKFLFCGRRNGVEPLAR